MQLTNKKLIFFLLIALTLSSCVGLSPRPALAPTDQLILSASQTAVRLNHVDSNLRLV